MGALISFSMMIVSLTVSTLMLAVNLTIRLLSTLFASARRSGPSRNRLSASTGRGFPVAFLIILLVILATSYPALSIGLAIITILTIVAWFVWRKNRSINASELAELFRGVQFMSGAQFEIFVAQLFEALGYKATVLGGPGDQGVDVLLRNGKERIAVQCKNYSRQVGNKPVQEVYAGARHHDCDKAWVIAPAGFTRGAFDLAHSVRVDLFDANSIHILINEADRLQKNRRIKSHADSKPVRSSESQNGGPSQGDEGFKPLEF